MNSSFITESHGFYVLKLRNCCFFQTIIYPWKESRNIAVFLWNYIKTFSWSMTFYQHENTIILLIIQSISWKHYFSRVLRDYSKGRNMICSYQVKSFDSILFNFKWTYKSFLWILFKSFVNFFIFLMKSHNIPFLFWERRIKFHEHLSLLILIDLIIYKSESFCCKSII